MKKLFSILSLTLLFCTLLLMSCSEKKVQVIINDGELEWPSIMRSQMWVGKTNTGEVELWAPFFQTEIDNTLRGINLMIKTCEPGTYSGTYDAANEKWSNDAIGIITMTIDYDGQPYPRWYGQTANVIIHSYNKKSNLLDATIEAQMVMEGTTNSRNIKVELKNLNVSGN